jgi:choline-sulfatase
LRFRRLILDLSLVGLAALVGCEKGDRASDGAAPSPTAPAASVAVAAPSASASAAAAASKPARPSEPLNVLLLTVDSLRADMPWVGYSREIAPNLTKLAKESVVYENAYSLSSYTAKSVGGFLTGRYPSTLYRDGYFFQRYYAANLFLTEVLQPKGIATIGWHGHMYFGKGKGLEQGFSTWELVPGLVFDPQTDKGITSEKMTKLGIELLSKPENVGKQFFAWAHYMDPHDEYNKHKESPDFGSKGKDKYDSEVFHTDLWLGKLLEWVDQQPWAKRTAIIVSADHGEAFGEHGMYRHAFELWEALTRVPLLVKAPGVTPHRIAERRSMIDLAPTVLDLMNVPAPPEFMGKSMVPELYGAEPDNREPIISELTEDSHNPPRRAIIQGDYKLIIVGNGYRHYLFNLKKDPGELEDLAKTEPQKLDEMKALAKSIYEKLPSVEPAGGNTLKEGGTARGPTGPAKTPAPDGGS